MSMCWKYCLYSRWFQT